MTTSELIDLQMTVLKAQNDETLNVLKKEKSPSEKACEMDSYLEPHKEVIQAR